MTSLFNSVSAQATYDPADAPAPPRLGAADGFALGYNEQYTQTRMNAQYLLSSQIGENTRMAYDLGLNLPRIRSKDGNDASPEGLTKELTKHFAGEDSDLSADSIMEYENFVRETKDKYPQAKIGSLAERWTAFSTAAQQADLESRESRYGLVGGIGYLAGSTAAFMGDPVNAATSVVGAAPIAGARTLAAVGGAVVKEGLMQGAVEAGQEVAGQASFREGVGLDGGFQSSVERVGGALVLGGTFRGAAEGVGGLAGRVLGRDVGVAPEIDPDTPREFWGSAFKKKEAPTWVEIQAAERAKHADIALWADPALARTSRGEAMVMRDLEAVRQVADDWSGPPLWSDALLRSAAVMPDVPGFRISEGVDVNAVARQIDPDTFRIYDGLVAERDRLRAEIDAASSPASTTNEFSAIISKANDKVAELTDALGNRKLKPKQRQELTAQREAAMKERDDAMAAPRDSTASPTAQLLREEFSKVDYKLRDIAPQVTRAYARAEGDFVASSKLNNAVKQMIEGRTNRIAGDHYKDVVDDAAKNVRAPVTSEDMMRARMGSAVPGAGDTMAEAIIRAVQQEADAIEESLEGFIGSAARSLSDEKGGKITIGTTEMDLNAKVFLPAEGKEGFREATVREMLEDMRAADENEKAMKSCLI